MKKYLNSILLGLACVCLGVVADPMSHAASAQTKVFEIRTYTTPEGELDELHKRFREHTMHLFEKHGMTNIAYWVPQDPALASHTLIYVLAHKSRAAAEKSWANFSADPEWKKVKAASEANGPIVTKVESVFVEATDYSPMK
ncbi:MAG TPA: NIPSNAP family protein [Povalibacter sp.]